jgi:hypothetical protein
MQSLSAADFVNLWEQGAGLHAIDRALLVLSFACPEHSRDALVNFALGHRDALLLEVHRRTFGDRLDAYTECPECQESLEFSLSCALLSGEVRPPAIPTKIVTIQGNDLTLRCPNSRDAAAAAASEDLEAAKKVLLALCAVPAAGSVTDIDALPEPARAAIAGELAVMDPLAETLVDLACPACGHGWQGIFEIMTFLWTEICARARRLLQEVDVLARVYGWSEADILAMSETRRGLYVQMAMA